MSETSEIGLPSQDDVARVAANRIWDIRVVHELHTKKIHKWLKDQATDKITLAALGHDQDHANSLIESAKDHYRLLSQDLERTCVIDGIVAQEQLMRDAEQGKLKDRAPTKGAIGLWLFLLSMAAGLELLFFSYMVFFKDAGTALIGLAILLVVGGIFVGTGFGNLMAEGHKANYEKRPSEILKKNIVLAAIGFLLLTGVIAIRWVYGGSLAGIVVVFFSLSVSTTDTFLAYSRKIRHFYLDKMYLAQKHYALVQLRKDLRQPDDHLDDTWRLVYEKHINDAVLSLTASTSKNRPVRVK